MRTSNIFLFLGLLVSFFCHSQNLSGEYFIHTSNGEIILSIQEKGSVEITGFFKAEDGIKYTIQGQEEEGEAYGFIIAPNGSNMYFEAYPEGEKLLLAIAPLIRNQEIDYDKMQDFLLRKRNPSGNQIVDTDHAQVRLKQSQDKSSINPIQGMMQNPRKIQSKFAGVFYSNINGTASVLNSSVNGSNLTGILDAAGYKYSLQATISEDKLTGLMVDNQTNGQLEFIAETKNGQLIFTFTSRDPNTGQPVSFDLIFSNEKIETSDKHSTTAKTNISLDQNICGLWTYSESHTSGQYSFAAQWQMQLNTDGSYLYGKGKVAGGGQSIGGVSGEGNIDRGKWKTENGNIHINEGQGWYFYAGYYIEGNKLLLKFNDGSKQIWYR